MNEYLPVSFAPQGYPNVGNRNSYGYSVRMGLGKTSLPFIRVWLNTSEDVIQISEAEITLNEDITSNRSNSSEPAKTKLNIITIEMPPFYYKDANGNRIGIINELIELFKKEFRQFDINVTAIESAIGMSVFSPFFLFKENGIFQHWIKFFS